MDDLFEFSDERLRAWCVHCGGWLQGVSTNRDHVPSKSLLQKPFPNNLPVIEVCTKCNSAHSLDEQYFVCFLSAVLSGSTQPDEQIISSATRAFTNNQPLKSRIERSRQDYDTIGGEQRTVWRPELDRLNSVVLKNARGHALFELSEAKPQKPNHIWTAPLDSLTYDQREGFENVPGDLSKFAGYPEIGSRQFTRILTGQDMYGGWVIVQPGIYRYLADSGQGVLIRSVLYDYLATEVYWND